MFEETSCLLWQSSLDPFVCGALAGRVRLGVPGHSEFFLYCRPTCRGTLEQGCVLDLARQACPGADCSHVPLMALAEGSMTNGKLPGTEPSQGCSDEDVCSQPFKSDPKQTSVLLFGATCRVTPWLCPKPAEHWWFRFQRKSDGREQI